MHFIPEKFEITRIDVQNQKHNRVAGKHPVLPAAANHENHDIRQPPDQRKHEQFPLTRLAPDVHIAVVAENGHDPERQIDVEQPDGIIRFDERFRRVEQPQFLMQIAEQDDERADERKTHRIIQAKIIRAPAGHIA